MSGALPESLREALDDLYHAFSRYPLGAVDGCAHCIGDADHARLHARPLRDLAAEDLRRYAGKAMTTWGDSRDFRHFLPRICELLATDDGFVQPEIALAKLDYARWRTWPGREQRPMEAYLHALWRSILAAYPAPLPAYWDADTFLCAISCASSDLAAYLATWREVCAASTPALRHLAAFLLANSESIVRKGHLRNAFWRECPAQMRRCIDWLSDPATGTLLERGFFAADGEAAQELSDATTVVAGLAGRARTGYVG